MAPFTKEKKVAEIYGGKNPAINKAVAMQKKTRGKSAKNKTPREVYKGRGNQAA